MPACSEFSSLKWIAAPLSYDSMLWHADVWFLASSVLQLVQSPSVKVSRSPAMCIAGLGLLDMQLQ